MSRNRNKKSKILRVLIGVGMVLALLHIGIVIAGKTYLYKGIQHTYLKGRTGPGIYDSIIFPVRVAPHSVYPENWKYAENQVQLSERAVTLLEETKTTSFLILKNGEIVHESYFLGHHETTKSNTFSMAKTLVGLMIGIAIDEGKINSFDDEINDYLPFHLENSEGVTIRDLLGMSSGISWTESGADPFSDNAEAYYTDDLSKVTERQKFIEKPGIFEYKSGNSQILGVILQEATGQHPTDYFHEKIWSKLGTESDFLWSLDSEGGMEKTFCCGYATAKDFARIGQFILNGGTWNNTRLINEATLAELSAPFSEKTSHYGLHFWRYEHPEHPAVYLRGILGQYIIAVPSLDLVIVRTGHERRGKYSAVDGKIEPSHQADENNYLLHHPLDIFDYFSILDELFIEK